MDLSIIIVDYNSKEKTLNCLKSIYESDLGDIEFEIILVDNYSNENIESEIKSNYPKTVYVGSSKNLGMGGGNNLGIKRAEGKYILILNPDTIVEQDAIKKLYDYIKENKDVGIVGPKLLNSDGSLQYSCFRQLRFLTPIFRRTFLGRLAKKHLNNFLMNDFNHNEIKEVDWLMGSCLMARRDVLEKIKIKGVGHPIGCPTPSMEEYFDEKFFMYFEDTDLCRRAWRAGYKVVYFPDAQIVHDHGRASAENPWYLAPFLNKLSRVHIASWIKYFLKWR